MNAGLTPKVGYKIRNNTLRTRITTYLPHPVPMQLLPFALID